jgi:hypothetical protein
MQTVNKFTVMKCTIITADRKQLSMHTETLGNIAPKHTHCKD